MHILKFLDGVIIVAEAHHLELCLNAVITLEKLTEDDVQLFNLVDV